MGSIFPSCLDISGICESTKEFQTELLQFLQKITKQPGLTKLSVSLEWYNIQGYSSRVISPDRVAKNLTQKFNESYLIAYINTLDLQFQRPRQHGWGY